MTQNIQDYNADEIRRKAEEIIRHKQGNMGKQISDAEKLRLYHELEVHQIELELQNEELIHSREEAKAAKKYTELYEAAPTSFFTLDKTGKILEMNAFASQLLEQKKEYLINSYITTFVHPEDLYIFNSFLKNVFSNHAQCTCEIRLQLSKPLGPVYVILRGILVSHWEKCLLTAMDITEQKRTLQSLIENQRLSAIGEMTSSIAHDFNNALQLLLGNLELALNAKDNSGYLNTMKTLITDAADRVRQLQRFNGIDADREQSTYINITSLVEDVIVHTRPLWKDQAEAKGICFLIEYEAEEVFGVRGNKGELRAVLFNIIKNSLEAMPKGGIIKIKSRKENNYVYLTITDTGVGMDEETKMRIFQPFFSTKDLNPGRGMGMSGVMSIVKEHKGEVSVKNTAPGLGTTIEIKLSLFKEKKEPEGTDKQNKETFATEHKVLNILWVDDDDNIRAFAAEAIKMMGHEVTLAESGKKALQCLEQDTYDLVITDIGMPEMNGWQLADKIKAKPYNIKVAVISGWGAQIKEAELSEHGVKYMLNKPFQLTQLKELLEHLV